MSFPLFQCIFLLCSLPLVIRAQNNKNITLGSILTAGDASKSSWISPSGDFAFGFQQVDAIGGFIAAIWYNKIPDKTITWSANRDELAQQGSKLQLTVNGLVLNDPNGNEMWTATGSGVAYAAMLDTGNLMLADENGNTLWQSFDAPTDTILPTQIMSQNTALIAQLLETNYSSGRFQLIMQGDGNLVQYTLNWPQNSVSYFPYFATNTVGSGYQVVFNQSGMIYVVAKNGTLVAQVLNEQMNPTQDHYQRAILEFDGVFRRYVYPRSSSANQPMNWTMATDFVPQDICKQMNVVKGGGACGFNSYCEIGSDQKPKCGYPPGYSFFDEMDRLKGCKRDFIAQSCLEEPRENDEFELIEMGPANFWGLDSDRFQGISETACHDLCLSDCLCSAVVFSSGNCWKKRFPLSNGWVGPDAGSRVFIKVGNVNSTTNPEPAQRNGIIQGGGDKHRVVVLVESVFLGSSVFVNVLLLTLAVLLAGFCRRKRKGKNHEEQDIGGTNMRSFGHRELQEATNGFKEVIGQGAYATVYKGLLDGKEGKVIAVKRLNEPAKDSQEFEREVKAIARTGHRNLVQLIGFCNEEQNRLLVYEYMRNGSIADILFRDQRPNWSKRIKFAFETARGLNYLHEECSIQIIHCDIKPQNVLLDESFTARISDFGLVKLLKKDQTHTLTGIMGTKGYVAPEWFRNIPITTKVDVYSFGILLLEIICCRRCFVAEMEDENQKVLADWAFDCCKEGRIDKLVEGDYEALHHIEKVKKYVMIALCCTQEEPSNRPSMNEVMLMIKGEIEESLPRNLASYFAFMNDGSGDAQYFSTESVGSIERPLTMNGVRRTKETMPRDLALDINSIDGGTDI